MIRKLSYDPSSVQELIETLSDKSTARLKAAKQLQLIGRDNPSLLYSHFHVFDKLLDGSSSVLLWNASIILSYLVSVDSNKYFDRILDRYYRHLWDGKLVTAANILASSGRIAHHRPDLAARITDELLKVDIIPLPTLECREVARGHVLASLADYPESWQTNQSVYDFIHRCILSHRPVVKKRAEGLLNKYFPKGKST
jgi:hypothetical protein